MNPPIDILLVEDDERSRKSTERYLRDNGFAVTSVVDAESAEAALADQWRSILVVDYRLPGKDGIALIEEVTRRRPGTPCILITAHGDVQSAVRAMKAGAFQFIEKPVAPAELLEVIRQACEKERLVIEVDRLRRELDHRYGFESIIGRSPAMREVFETIRLVAPTRSTVLVTGESGTGKELVAQAIHQNSPRRDGPFIPVNCAALPKDLVESELFGHEKGAFTGAQGVRRGYFEAANGGTLFVDEVGEMSPASQVKVLRALEQKVVSRVGSTEEIPVDVRIVAATNRDLDAAVKAGRFRDDLYYRLCVVRIDLPPLRERAGDIPLLASTFLRGLNAEHGRRVTEIAPEAFEVLESYGWPGNVRELRNVLESVIVLSTKERIDLDDLPPRIRGTEGEGGRHDRHGEDTDGEGRTLAEIEKGAILNTLRACGGNRTQAAKRLGIAVRTVQRKLAEYGEDDA